MGVTVYTVEIEYHYCGQIAGVFTSRDAAERRAAHIVATDSLAVGVYVNEHATDPDIESGDAGMLGSWEVGPVTT